MPVEDQGGGCATEGVGRSDKAECESATVLVGLGGPLELEGVAKAVEGTEHDAVPKDNACQGVG